ncbi:MAG: hypothetical protein IJZ23_00425 [Roseburia sp.]|nr:hypothetical protein [Roseburia sp.]
MRREVETRTYYTEGNTVRQMSALPASMPDYREERRKREEAEREAELRRKKRIARKNQEKALRTSRRYVMFLSMGAILFAGVAGLYINIQSDITARMKTISKLESQISDLKAENDEAYKRISTAIDLDAIKNTAINELGMFYATSDQIVYYTVENDDYMNQYIEIPEE